MAPRLYRPDVATFLAGLRFTRVPNTHLDEFRVALAHGEILLMVDTTESRLADIEARIHRHHPEAAIGGVGWGAGAFGTLNPERGQNPLPAGVRPAG